ncbi:DUF6542 domain-containing protein [Nonomuraea sp. NPDC059194]|uniref:DUF6542 domain-containing protein n=1 Tax=Nonomuraea sp. NPDC059194 TaxID=3346764 RepID=UPI00368DCEFE
MGDKGRRPAVKLTARGAIALILIGTLAGYVVAALVDLPILVGLAFIGSCLVGVTLVNPRELLSLVVTPPMVFFGATLIVELGRALGKGSVTQALALGLFTSLSAGAPWLFAGSAMVLAIAWKRGLTANVRELRDELRTGVDIPRPRAPRDQAFVPEPEGYYEPKVYGTPRSPDE